jgi:hypothetical protein
LSTHEGLPYNPRREREARALAAILEAARGLGPVRIIGGRQVVSNVRSQAAVDALLDVLIGRRPVAAQAAGHW